MVRSLIGVRIIAFAPVRPNIAANSPQIRGDADALQCLIDFAAHKDHLFRAACAWPLGFLGDLSGKTALQDLTRAIHQRLSGNAS